MFATLAAHGDRCFRSDNVATDRVSVRRYPNFTFLFIPMEHVHEEVQVLKIPIFVDRGKTEQ
jgi:hypothetical protein